MLGSGRIGPLAAPKQAALNYNLMAPGGLHAHHENCAGRPRHSPQVKRLQLVPALGPFLWAPDLRNNFPGLQQRLAGARPVQPDLLSKHSQTNS